MMHTPRPVVKSSIGLVWMRGRTRGARRRGAVVIDDLGAKAPKYQRIASALRADIREGTYGPGDRLPAETALMERFKVSLPTLRQAIGLLRAEGLVESRHGIGTFVREDRRLTRRSR